MQEATPRGQGMAVFARWGEIRVPLWATAGAVLLAIVLAVSLTLLVTQVANGANAMPTPPPAPGYGSAVTPAHAAWQERVIGESAYHHCVAPAAETSAACGTRVGEELGLENSITIEFVKPSGARPKASLPLCPAHMNVQGELLDRAVENYALEHTSFRGLEYSLPGMPSSASL